MGLHGPKNGMKINKLLSIGGRLASSRFSGQMSYIIGGIAKKISPCPLLSSGYSGRFSKGQELVSKL
jgi:hypothetical protein